MHARFDVDFFVLFVKLSSLCNGSRVTMFVYLFSQVSYVSNQSSRGGRVTFVSTHFVHIA